MFNTFELQFQLKDKDELQKQLAKLQLQANQQAASAAASSSSSSSSADDFILVDNNQPGSSIQPRIPGEHWIKSINQHIHFHKKREKKEASSQVLRTRDEVYMDPMQGKACNGDLRLKKLQWWLNNLGVQRSPDQVLFHKAFTNATLPKIFGEKEWNENSVRVMHDLGIKEIRFEVTAITPRRWGKTWSVAMFVLSLMLAVPGIRICVFSTGKRASTSLMEIICQFMGNVPELAGRKVKENQEELYIADAALDQGSSSNSTAAKQQRQSSHTSKLFCYPCSVTGT